MHVNVLRITNKSVARVANCSVKKISEIRSSVRCYSSTKTARNAFIRDNVERYDVKEKKPSKKLRDRKSSFRYFLTLTEGSSQRKVEVCKPTFLAVTGFREKVIRQNSVDQGAPAPKRRGMFGGRGEKSVADREFLDSFFDRIEKAPSHYC